VLKYDFEASIGYWLLRTAHEYERAVNLELAPHGITFRQCQVLGWLALEGEMCQRDLAERLRVEPPTLVSQLDRMESDGWIERVSCAGDRRKKLIRPMHGVLPVWSQIVACAKRVRERATQGLGREQVDLLKALLEAVRRNLTAAYPECLEGSDDASATTSRAPASPGNGRVALGSANGNGAHLGPARSGPRRGGRRDRKGSAGRRRVRGQR
jgi:MarR family transcriptional regulator for hemolysin